MSEIQRVQQDKRFKLRHFLKALHFLIVTWYLKDNYEFIFWLFFFFFFRQQVYCDGPHLP